MRLEMNFEVEKKLFQVEFRRIFISFIKKTLSEYNSGQLYEKFYKDTNPKNYSFSIIFQKPVFRNDYIELGGNNLKLILSTDDRDKTGLYLFSAFIPQKNVIFNLPNGNSMTLKSIGQKSNTAIKSSKAIFRTVTGGGLCIREHVRNNNSDRYYTYNDDGFLEQFRFVLGEQALKAGFSKTQIQNINFKPIECKKVVAKHYGMCIDVTAGMFAMEANPEVLQFFYNAGVGSRRSAGFGLLELVTDDCI